MKKYLTTSVGVIIFLISFIINSKAQPNYCLNFPGVTGKYVSLGTNINVYNRSSITLEMWVNVVNLSPQDCFFSVPGTDYNLTFNLGNPWNVIKIGLGKNISASTPSGVIFANEWFHLAFAFDGTAATDAGKVKIFINGLQQTLSFSGTLPTKTPAAAPVTSGSILLGADISTGKLFTGLMDEVRIWGIARTSTEIQATMAEPLNGNEDYLLAYYKLDESGSTSTAPDATVYGNNGSLINFSYTPSPWIPRAVAEPLTQASGITVQNIYNTQSDISWTNGSGSSRVVFMAEGDITNQDLTDNTIYLADAAFKGGTQIGTSGWYCIYNGTGNSVKMSNLRALTTYKLRVFEYNGTEGVENYFNGLATNNPKTFITTNTDPPATEPTTQSSNILATPQVNSCNLMWQKGNGIARVVFAKLDGTGVPGVTDGTNYEANNSFGSGTQIGTTGWYCVYKGTQTTFDITGLSSNSQYRVMVLEYNESGSNPNYLATTATLNPVDFVTKLNVTSSGVTNINATKATVNGNVETGGNKATVTGKGIIYSTIDGFNPIEGINISFGATGPGNVVINITGLTPGTNYYYTIYANENGDYTYSTQASFTTDTKRHWTGLSGSNWAAGNWEDNTLPGTDEDIFIPAGLSNYPVLGNTDNVFARSLTVEEAASFTLNAGGKLTLSSNLINSGTIVINSDAAECGSLIIGGTATGSFTFNRYLTKDKWHMISSPVNGESIADFLQTNSIIPVKNISGTDCRGMMSYNTTTNTWNSYFLNNGQQGYLTQGEGFSLRANADGVVSFSGTDLASDNVNVTLTRSGYNGWNLVGNPFISALNANSLANSENNIISINTTSLDDNYEALYIWDEQAGYSGNRSDYKIINHAGGDNSLGQNYIQAGQGFFVKTATNGATFTMTRAMQTHQPTVAFKSAELEWSNLSLEMKQKDAITSTSLRFRDDMTAGLDIGYDAGALKTGYNIYTQLVESNGVDFGMQCLPISQILNYSIPVGVDLKTAGDISFSLKMENFPSDIIPVLFDRLKNIHYAFKSGEEIYTTAVTDNLKGFGRFELQFTNTTGLKELVQDEPKLRARFSEDKIILEGEMTGESEITVFDMQGRKLQSLMGSVFNRLILSVPEVSNGIYIIQVRNSQNTEKLKVVKTSR